MKIDLDLLRLDFTPQSVRDHYDGWDPEQAGRFTDIELAEAAEQMLCEDYTWRQLDYMMDRIIEIIEQHQHTAAEETGSMTLVEGPTEKQLLRDLGDPADWPI